MSDALRRVVALSSDFESKTRDLITVTRACSIPQLLSLRRMTLDDASTRKWASGNQVKVIFNVVLTSKLQALGGPALRQSQEGHFEGLLPPLGKGYNEEQREADRETLLHGVIQALTSVYHKETMSTLVAVRHVVSNDDDFEVKARDLIALTKSSSIPQVLALRHQTLRDAETLELVDANQVKVIFNVVLTAKLQALGTEALRQAQETGFDAFLPPIHQDYDEKQREMDRETLVCDITQAQAQNSMSHSEAPAAPSAAPASPAGDAAPQAKARPAKPAKPQESTPASSGPVTFEEVFDGTICRHIRKSLSTIEITSSGGKSLDGLPFMVAPGFGDSLERVLRTFVLSHMRKTRSIRTMSESYNWQESGAATILEIINSGEANNPILHAWDSRWTDFRAAPKAAAAGAEKKGLLGGLSKSAPAKPAGQTPADDGAALWTQLKKDAVRGKYLAPTNKDLAIFQTLIRYNPAAFLKALHELDDLYQQEFAPKANQEPGREGSFRDGLNKWNIKLPPHIGEFVAVKLYYTYDALDLDYLKNFSRGHGKSVEERKRTIPYLMAFMEKQGVE